MTDTKLVKRTVKNKAHSYFVEKEGVRSDMTIGPVAVEQMARRGDEIELTEAQAKLGDDLGAFYSDAELKAIAARGETVADGAPAGPPNDTSNTVDLATMDTDATRSWLEGAGPGPKPSIPQVLNAVNEAPEAEREEIANRVLEAERSKSTDPRSTLVGPLEDFLAEDEPEPEEE